MTKVNEKYNKKIYLRVHKISPVEKKCLSNKYEEKWIGNSASYENCIKEKDKYNILKHKAMNEAFFFFKN